MFSIGLVSIGMVLVLIIYTKVENIKNNKKVLVPSSMVGMIRMHCYALV